MKCENCKNEPTCRFKAEGKTKEHCNFYISSSPEPSGAQLSTEYKAALWDGLMACGRIRVLGLARDGDDGKQGPINHIGLELWATFEPTLAVQINTGIGRGLLAEFARGVDNDGGKQ